MESEDLKWTCIEYEELHRYGRTIYETFFRLAQMSFVLNGTLGAAFSYIYRKENQQDMWWFGLLTVSLGIIYNIGALSNFIRSMSFLHKLLIGIKNIENRVGGDMYGILVTLLPLTFSKVTRRERVIAYFYSTHGLTVAFFILLVMVWAAALLKLLSMKWPVLWPFPASVPPDLITV